MDGQEPILYIIYIFTVYLEFRSRWFLGQCEFKEHQSWKLLTTCTSLRYLALHSFGMSPCTVFVVAFFKTDLLKQCICVKRLGYFT